MLAPDRLQPLKELLPSVQTALVIVPTNPTMDQLASGIALHQALEVSGRQAVLLSPQPLSPELATMVGAEAVQNQLGNRDLNISFEYRPEAVDKVSYHIDDQSQRFFLVIKPQKGQRPLDTSTIQFSYSGADADLIFLIGVSQYESLEQLYFGFEQLYQTAHVVTFHVYEPEIGTIKLDASGASSLSESMVSLIRALELPLNATTATHLLTAIEAATNNFNSLATTAETFETVADLLRQGARRTRRAAAMVPASQPTPTNPFAQALQPQPVVPTQSQPEAKPVTKKNKTKKPAAAGGLDHQPSMGVSSR